MKKYIRILLAAVLCLTACKTEGTAVTPREDMPMNESTIREGESAASAENINPDAHLPEIGLTAVIESTASSGLLKNGPMIKPKPQSNENPIKLNGINFGPGFQRGVNFGNMLEAPREGEWGVRARDEYFPIVKEMGFDFIRLPVRWNAHTAGDEHTIKPAFLDRVDHLVEQALEHGLGLIINIHHFDGLDNEPEKNKEKLYAIWRQLSVHYADLPLNVVFEVNNEPHGNLTQELWIEYQNKCIEIIRETNPTRKILVTGAGWGGPGTVPSLILPKDDNLLVSFHHYDPFVFTHQGADWTNDPKANTWVGTEWHGTELEIKQIEKPFTAMRAWSEATGIPVVLGEFGAYEKGDMASRARWTAAMRELAEAYGFAWSYWEFCSGFGVYNPRTEKIHEPLAAALTGIPVPEDYGYKKGAPKYILEETDDFIGPARMDVKVSVICDSWTGISLSYTEDSTALIELGGPERVPDWAQIYIPLPLIKDTGEGFNAKYVNLTFRNIDKSITDLCVNIDNGGITEAEILWPPVKELLEGNKKSIIINADGTTTMMLDISRGYRSLKGKTENGIRLKLFVESVPEPHKVNAYDRHGSLEFIGVEIVTD